jgi:DNA-directed RNA polymerase alpha subunit
MGIKNFGATSLKEVKERLVEYGLGLRLIEA